MRFSFCLSSLLALAALTACDSTRETTTGRPTPTRASAPAPAAVAPGFRRELTSGSYRYVVSTRGPAGTRVLAVRAEQNGQELTTALDTIAGEVQQAQLAKLTTGPGDELLIFLRDDSRNAAGTVRGYWFGGQDWEPMEPLPPLTSAAARGYRGQDQFEVRGNMLRRSFPVYQPADAACCPSGGLRTIRYRMAESSLAFRQVEVVNEPKAAR
ncbi:hypothetical protein [Hymenobacter algoricola]|uniref:Uncharacterized protein n=1 Tax=Hymenobacter algoricola TaxID=486267 RepID=A0ABP7MR86_9BACT